MPDNIFLIRSNLDQNLMKTYSYKNIFLPKMLVVPPPLYQELVWFFRLNAFSQSIGFILATYGIWGKYWFSNEKMKKKTLEIFTFQDFFLPKKHDLSDKNLFRLSCAVAFAGVTHNLGHAYSLPLRS
jgi:hypothetical protein